VNALERLGRHPCAHLEKDFIMQFRKLMTVQSELHAIPEIMRDESGRPFVTQEARRKWAKASVKVTAQGTGLIEINMLLSLCRFSSRCSLPIYWEKLTLLQLLLEEVTQARLEPYGTEFQCASEPLLTLI